MQHFWVTQDSWQDIEAIGWSPEQELCRLIAKSKKYGPIYRKFNQWNTERFWYSCVIVSWLRSWYSLWAPSEDFTSLMYDLCDHMENKGLWAPKSWWAVHEIWDEFVKYMNNRFPTKKVWKTKVSYGSSAMGGCLKRNIPIVTAYIHSKEYGNASSDWEITGEETKGIRMGNYGHCITITWLWPMWSYLEFQDNYERAWKWNTYNVWFFNRLREKTWYKNCFWALLPEDIKVADKKDRASIVNAI